METKARSLGDRGEEKACRYLRNCGYRIVARNWHCRFGEIDIIARDGDTLAFIEVKTRTREGYGGPEAAIDLWKRRRLIASARVFLSWASNDMPARFDVLAVSGDRLRLIRDAFGADD